MKRIAERMKAFRKLRGLSQRELAELAGVSVTTINRIENEEDTVLSTIIKIERVLDVKLY